VQTLNAILKDDPPDLSASGRSIPAGLERIVRHCLEKGRGERFQSARDVAFDLESLLEVSAAPALREDAESGKLPAAIPSSRGAFSRLGMAGLAIAALALVTGAWLWLGRPTAPAPEAPLVATPLTTSPGFEVQPTFSPDGNEVAFVWNGAKEDNYDIYRKLIGSGEPLRLTRDPARDSSPAWSPDGRFIAFLRHPTQGTAGVYLIPALGGAERRLADISLGPEPWEVPYKGLAWTANNSWLVVSDQPVGESPGLFLLQKAARRDD
jgi:hypothetical protein